MICSRTKKIIPLSCGINTLISNLTKTYCQSRILLLFWVCKLVLKLLFNNLNLAKKVRWFVFEILQYSTIRSGSLAQRVRVRYPFITQNKQYLGNLRPAPQNCVFCNSATCMVRCSRKVVGSSWIPRLVYLM